jgi:hypothetical protein
MDSTISGALLPDEDRERLNIIRKAIAAGAYHVDAEDVAAKLILSMLEFDDDPSSLSDWGTIAPNHSRNRRKTIEPVLS